MRGEPEGLFAFGDDVLRDLAEAHGTPLFAYSREVLARTWRRLRGALPDGATVAYAVKANPNRELLAQLALLGASFDCASIGELDRVAELGVPGARLFFAGPGKREPELARALELGVRVQAEGFEDLERLDRLASGPVAVNLRVHPRGGVEERGRIIGGAGPSAFGVDEEQVPEILERAARLSRVQVRGLHVFAASNERDAERLLSTHRMVFGLARRLAREHGVQVDMVDVGGGLGVPYREGEDPLDVDRLGRGLAALLAEFADVTRRVVLEPGRYVAAPGGVYLARVVRVKESRGVRFAILEGGVNHLLRPALIGDPFPVRAVGRAGGAVPHTLAGPLCTSLDRLGDVELPALAPGDLLAFGMTGAYGFTEGMTHFLSHPVPPEVWA